MAHFLLALPHIEHFHLYGRLARKLLEREHRITLVVDDPVTFEFFSAQGLRAVELRPRPASPAMASRIAQLPIIEFAGIDCQLTGRRAPTARALANARHRIERLAPAAFDLFDTDPPDLAHFHQGRSGTHALLRFMARQYGSSILHTAEGLLPQTMQCDEHGIDGDASFSNFAAKDYRRTQPDEVFVAAALSGWLARAYPPPLARVGVIPPTIGNRLGACLRAARQRRWDIARSGLCAWQRAYPTTPARREDQPPMPPAPYVTVLLQSAESPRLLLDSSGVVDPLQLVLATRNAAHRIEPRMPIVVVLPKRGVTRAEMQRLASDGHHLVFVPASTAAIAVSTAAATITINHPLGLAAILAGTPVLHLGRTPYGVREIAHRTSLDLLSDDLRQALHHEAPPLRLRFLTRMLHDFHLWCSVRQPDLNGLAGLVMRMESAVTGANERAGKLHYRPGPVWPLAASTPG